MKVETVLLKELKLNFYDWCSYLSIDEVISNESLIVVIEKVERLLIAVTQ